jgi:hypothetical protein
VKQWPRSFTDQPGVMVNNIIHNEPFYNTNREVVDEPSLKTDSERCFFLENTF